MFFPNLDMHIFFLYLHFTPRTYHWIQLAIKSLALNDSLIREKGKLIHLGMIKIADTSEEALLEQHNKSPSIPKIKILAIISQTRVPNPLSQLLL